MSTTLRNYGTIALLTTVFLLQTTDGWPHAGHGSTAGTRTNKPSRQPRASIARGAATEHTTLADKRPHGGHIHRSAYHSFEVLYLPHETRIYVYGPTEWPTSALGVAGSVAMQVRGNPTTYRYELRYVPKSGSDSDQDYLVADVDVTRIRDGDMNVTIELSQLPYSPIERNAAFSQQFALSSNVVPRFASTHLQRTEDGDASPEEKHARRGFVQRFFSFVGLARNSK